MAWYVGIQARLGRLEGTEGVIRKAGFHVPTKGEDEETKAADDEGTSRKRETKRSAE